MLGEWWRLDEPSVYVITMLGEWCRLGEPSVYVITMLGEWCRLGGAVCIRHYNVRRMV